MHTAIAILVSLPTGYLLGIFLHSGCPRRAMQSMILIDELRAHEGAIVEISCDNPEPDTKQDQACVTVTDDWTDWNPRSFYGEDVLDCLQKARHERDLETTIVTAMTEQGKVAVKKLGNCSLDVCPHYSDCIFTLVCKHPRE